MEVSFKVELSKAKIQKPEPFRKLHMFALKIQGGHNLAPALQDETLDPKLSKAGDSKEGYDI
jgi:hypothetical protein